MLPGCCSCSRCRALLRFPGEPAPGLPSASPHCERCCRAAAVGSPSAQLGVARCTFMTPCQIVLHSWAASLCVKEVVLSEVLRPVFGFAGWMDVNCDLTGFPFISLLVCDTACRVFVSPVKCLLLSASYFTLGLCFFLRIASRTLKSFRVDFCVWSELGVVGSTVASKMPGTRCPV